MIHRRFDYAKWRAFSPYTLDFVSVDVCPFRHMGEDEDMLVRRDAAVRAARIKRTPLKRKMMGKKRA